MYRVTKRFRFEAAHQLDRAFSKACTDCVHGHSYVVEVTLAADVLNDDYMVLDFGHIKDIIKASVEEFDHALLLPASLVKQYAKTPSRKIVNVGCNPTAEVMAKAFFDVARCAIQGAMDRAELNVNRGVRVEKVRVQETETGWAEYEEVRR